MSNYELAQLNVATMKESLESPSMADFVANLDRINALAETSPGFVWRLQTEEGDATAMRPMGEETLVNISVWKDAESLNKYVYESAHVEIMRRRKEWFQRMREAYVVLWWVPRGHRPTSSKAITKLVASFKRADQRSIHAAQDLLAARCAAARFALFVWQ
jgi:hypothetical protein